jgi:hypothetical protein
MKTPPQPNAANIFELYRRRISKIDHRFPPPHFTLHNIDIIQLYLIYSEYFPYDIKELFKALTEVELKALHVPAFELKLQSTLVTHHSKFNQYNDLYREFDESNSNLDISLLNSTRNAYVEKVITLNAHIANDIILQFNKCISSVKGADKLKPHLDTLFFVCIFFYNLHWDVYGTDFNGEVAEKGISKLTLDQQPHFYRAYNQTKYIGKLLLDYFKAPTKLGEINLVVGGKPHITDDPIITNWLMQSLLDSIIANKYPLSLDYLGGMLSQALCKRKSHPEVMLKELESLADIKSPTYRHQKRKVVRRFCLDIHKAFAYYLGTSDTEFNTVELKIYNNILKSFKMDDFSVKQREHQGERSSTPRKDIIENRLGELLRRKEE